LVDGVAINGVSGGPALSTMGGLFLMGVVSAYIPNRATGETLPGLGMVRDVVQLQGLMDTIHSLDEAKAEETPASDPPPSSQDTDGAVPSAARKLT